MNWDSFLGKRIKGCGFAIKGAWMLLKNEQSIQVQFVIALIMTVAGLYFEISKTEWIAQILCIGLVMGIEGINTAAEEMADFVHPDFHDKIGYIKDVAAGAVFFSAAAAIAIGCIIYLPKF